MYLLDSSCAERMESSTPQRKTVYRISLTLVKRESLDEEDGDSTPRKAENPKAGLFRREGSVEMQRGGLLEQLQEVEDESDELSLSSAAHGYMRNFRTFSTGQLELGRLKISKKHILQKELQEKSPSPVVENRPTVCKEDEKDAGLKEEEAASETPPTDVAVQNGGVNKKRFLKAKSMEERSSELPVGAEVKMSHSKSNGKAAAKASSPDTPPPKRPPGLLRRSFSFRHWSGGELLRLRALSKDKHHSSSGCIGRDAAPDNRDNHDKDAQVPVFLPAPPSPVPEPTKQKSRTLEMGAVLNKTDSMSELSRWERAQGNKNRTLDNSDLLRLAAEKEAAGAGGFLLRGGGGRSSERRLVRFFSGIFSRRDGASTSTPLGSPSIDRSLQRSKRRVLSQSSTESVNGGSTEGNGTVM